MSYDFSLSNPEVHKLSLGERISQEIEAGIFEFDPITEEQLAFNRRLASLLGEFNPAFKVVELRHGKEIQVTEPHGNGIDICIYRDGVSVTIPFWYRGEEAGTVFREIWKYLKFIQQETEYQVFDNQMDEVIDLDTPEDFLEALKVYEWTMGMINKTIRSNLPPNML